MAHNASQGLDAGDAFPAMGFTLAGGASLHLPDEWAGAWGVLLAYRGHW